MDYWIAAVISLALAVYLVYALLRPERFQRALCMTSNGLLQITGFFLLVLALTKPMGAFMTHIFEGKRTWLHPALGPLERLIYKLCGIQEDQEQRWTGYAASLLMFSLASLVLTYLIQRLQGFLPFNPQGFGTAHAAQGATAMTPDLAFNTDVSFTTNTNWQAYTPETTMRDRK